MKGLDGQRVGSHGELITKQHGAYPLPGHADTLDTPTYSVHTANTVYHYRVPCPAHGDPHPHADINEQATLQPYHYTLCTHHSCGDPLSTHTTTVYNSPHPPMYDQTNPLLP